MAQTRDVRGLRCPEETVKAGGTQPNRPAPSTHRRHSKAMSAPTPDCLCSSFVFIDILALFPRFRFRKHGFTPRRKAGKVRKAALPPTSDSPPWTRSGQGWLIPAPILCFHRHSRFVPRFSMPQTPVSRKVAKHAKVARPQHPKPFLIIAYDYGFCQETNSPSRDFPRLRRRRRRLRTVL